MHICQIKIGTIATNSTTYNHDSFGISHETLSGKDLRNKIIILNNIYVINHLPLATTRQN